MAVKIFQRNQRSLFGEILDWMLTPLLLLWPISLALTWLVAQNLANKPFDRALVYNAQALAQFIQPGPNHRLRFSLPQPASELLRADDADNVYYQVLGPKGEFLSGERELPPPAPLEGDEGARQAFDEPHLRDAEFRGLPVRIAHLWVPVADSATPALVQVAETREKRSVLAAEIIKGVMLPQFAILPLAVLLVWLALVRGIKPLSQLELRIRERRPDDLSPLDDHAVPQEVAPLVGSVNDLLTRLKDSIATQKRFLADAAHQLKTPLAGLSLQADLAQREGASAGDLKQSLQQIGHASERATHTVNQLLALARAENQPHAGLALEPLDLSQLARSVVQDWVSASFVHEIDLGYEDPDGAVEILGDGMMLRELLSNLIDNALRYTPAGGSVTVRVRRDGEHALLEVEDTGPGIAPAERAHVFERFYRILGSSASGSGLGLAIVREIAQQHGAEVDIFYNPRSHSKKYPGSLFRLTFPPPVIEPDDAA